MDCASLLFEPRWGSTSMMFVENATIYINGLHDVDGYEDFSSKEIIKLTEERIAVVLTHETLHAVLESIISNRVCCCLHSVDAWGYPISNYPNPPFE